MSNFRFTRPNALPPVVKYLIIINVIVYIAQISIGRQFGLTEKLMLYPLGSPQFNPYQIISHLFAHSPETIFHVIFNMWALFMFGKPLEEVWGSKRFLNFYLISGIGAAMVHLIVQYLLNRYYGIPQAEALGASGAVMGVVVAFGYLFSESKLLILPIPFPIKAKWAVLGLVAYDLFFGFTRSDNIAHFAHLGGALTGFILVFFWYRKDRRNFY